MNEQSAEDSSAADWIGLSSNLAPIAAQGAVGVVEVIGTTRSSSTLRRSIPCPPTRRARLAVAVQKPVNVQEARRGRREADLAQLQPS